MALYTIRSLAKELGVPYTTLRGYVNELKRMKVIRAPEGPTGLMIDERERMIIEEIVRLVRMEGYTLQSAVKRITEAKKENEVSLKLTLILEKLDEIEERLDRLEEACERRKKPWWRFWGRKR